MPGVDLHHYFVAMRDFVVNWWPLLGLTFYILLLYIFWRMLQLMPRVKPAEVDTKSRSAVTWADVAGVDEVRAELQEVVDFLRNPRRFEKLGARGPKGILLHGPPGTGKTLLAKAAAHESGASFYAASASLFVELDGFAGGEQVVVMAASNRLQDLDPALLRPGRFDRQIHVAEPDLAAREAILRVHTRGKPLASDVDLTLIARQTAGLTGAELANIANEAAIYAGRKNQQYIHQAEFGAAMERIVAGLQKRRVVSEKEKRILAYHEAGHAVMSHLVGDALPVQKVTIVARGEALGYTFHLPSEDRYVRTKEELLDFMKVALAGRAAEQIVFGRVTTGAANDLEKVTEIARSMVFEYGMGDTVSSRTMRADNYALSEETKRLRDHEQARLTDDAFTEALRLLEKHRAALDRVAHALLDRETLDRDALDALLADVEPESRSADLVGTPRVIPLPAAD